LNDCFPEVSHQTNQGCVPLVDDLGERGGTGGHQNCADAIFKGALGNIGNT